MRADMELLVAWREGDALAGNELFDRYFPAVHRFFANKIDDNIEDLVQQTFLACVDARDRIRSEDGFRAYLFATARSKLYDCLRGRGRLTEIDTGAVSVADLGISPSSVLANREAEQLVMNALRHIPIDLQVALELYYFEGMRGPELARVLDIPEGTVRSRVRRGLELLRKRVDELARSPELRKDTVTTLATWAQRLEDERR